RALCEKFDPRKYQRFARGYSLSERAAIERGEHKYLLTMDVKSFAAGRQNGDLGGFVSDRLHDRGGAVEDLLAIVEDDQDRPVAQDADQVGGEVLRRTGELERSMDLLH